MKVLFSILLLLPLFLQGQEIISKNNKAIATRYRQIPNNFTAWTAGTGSFTTVGANLPNGYIQCTSAGTAYIESKQAYGTWEFDLYKGNTANTTQIYFITNNPSTIAANSDYSIYFSVLEKIGINKPGTALYYETAAAYINNSTWYSLRITRSSTGVFTTYIKGGTFGNEWVLVSTVGGSGTNPFTNNDYTTSNYFLIDLDVGDRIRNVRFLPLNQNKYSIITTE